MRSCRSHRGLSTWLLLGCSQGPADAERLYLGQDLPGVAATEVFGRGHGRAGACRCLPCPARPGTPRCPRLSPKAARSQAGTASPSPLTSGKTPSGPSLSPCRGGLCPPASPSLHRTLLGAGEGGEAEHRHLRAPQPPIPGEPPPLPPPLPGAVGCGVPRHPSHSDFWQTQSPAGRLRAR